VTSVTAVRLSRFLLKAASDGAEMTDDGNLFHTRAPATPKAQSPMVQSLVRGTTSAGVSLPIAGIAESCRQ